MSVLIPALWEAVRHLKNGLDSIELEWLEPEGPSVSCLLLWSECWHPSTIPMRKPSPNMVQTWGH